MGAPKPLPKSFCRRETAEVARALLGCRLTRHLPDGSERSVLLVETEAYLGAKDRAAHTWNGRRTPRVAPMWGEGGHAYVYFVYGMHWCMNVVVEKEGVAAAVLLRALEPIENLPGRTQGPALLCQAMGIDKTLHGHDMLSRDFFITAPVAPAPLKIVKTTRIGVDYAGAWARRPLRFLVKGNPFVSKPPQKKRARKP